MKKSEDKNKWTDKILEEIFEECKAWFRPRMVLDNQDNTMKDIHENNLFLNNFLMDKGIYRGHVNEMAQTRPWLLDMYDELSEVQEHKMAKMGLLRKLDSSMVKFALSNKHNWREKTDNTSSVEVKSVDLKDLVSFKGGK
jgi:hypothetical protein